MRAKPVVALAGISLFAGYYIGAVSHDHVPDTRVVTVHTPGKVVTHTEHETKIVTKPLPDSCETVVDMLDTLVAAGAKLDGDSGDLLRQVEQIGPTALMSPQDVANIYSKIAKLKQAMDDDLSYSLDVQNGLPEKVSTCRDDVEASNEGADVAPLDGASGYHP